MHPGKVQVLRDAQFQLAPKEVLLLASALGIATYILGFLVGLSF